MSGMIHGVGWKYRTLIVRWPIIMLPINMATLGILHVHSDPRGQTVKLIDSPARLKVCKGLKKDTAMILEETWEELYSL